MSASSDFEIKRAVYLVLFGTENWSQIFGHLVKVDLRNVFPGMKSLE
jgi:hypothetical protein